MKNITPLTALATARLTEANKMEITIKHSPDVSKVDALAIVLYMARLTPAGVEALNGYTITDEQADTVEDNVIDAIRDELGYEADWSFSYEPDATVQGAQLEVTVDGERVNPWFNPNTPALEGWRLLRDVSSAARELRRALVDLGEEQLASLDGLDNDDEITMRAQGFYGYDVKITVREAREIIREVDCLDHTDVLYRLSMTRAENLGRAIDNFDADIREEGRTDEELTLHMLGLKLHGWSESDDALEVPIRF